MPDQEKPPSKARGIGMALRMLGRKGLKARKSPPRILPANSLKRRARPVRHENRLFWDRLLTCRVCPHWQSGHRCELRASLGKLVDRQATCPADPPRWGPVETELRKVAAAGETPATPGSGNPESGTD